MGVSALHLLQERHLERQALAVCRSATFLDTLRMLGITPTIQVAIPKRQMVTVRASDIYGRRSRFFAPLPLEQVQDALTSRREELVALSLEWLQKESTERYRHFSTSEQHDWLKQVVALVVTRELMEQKYTWLCTHGTATFADPWVASQMHYLHVLHTLPGKITQLVYHIMRDPEQQQGLLEQFWADLDVSMQECLVGVPEPLPPLPEEMRPLLTHLIPQKEDIHE